MNRLKESVQWALAANDTVNTQAGLAEVLGMAPSQFSRALSNPKRTFNVTQQVKLAKFLGQTPTAILGILSNDRADQIELEGLSTNETLERVEYDTLKQKYVSLSDDHKEVHARLIEVNDRIAQVEMMQQLMNKRFGGDGVERFDGELPTNK